MKRDGYDLLIIDPLANFAPWKDENNAADVGYAMTELNEFAKAGLALLCCHHATKQTGSARGSSALTAAPDINLCLKHTKRKLNNEMVFDFDHTDRVLTGNGRFVEIPLSTKLAFDLFTRSYQLRLSDQERSKITSGEKVLQAVSEAVETITRKELFDLLEPGLKEKTIVRRLDALVSSGQVIQTGDGKAGNPYKYEINKEYDSLNFII